MAELIELVGQATQRQVLVDHHPDADGDVERTGGAIDRASELLSWSPSTSLAEGVQHQVAWHVGRRSGT